MSVSFPAAQHDDVVYPPVASGGGAGAPHYPVLPASPDSDPSGIVTSSSAGGGVLTAEIDDSVLSQTPGAGALWYAPLVDYNGDARSLTIGDLWSCFLWTAQVHTGKVVWIGVRSSSTGAGLAWGLYNDGASWRCIRSSSPDGVTWTNATAGAASVNTIGVQGTAGVNTSAQASFCASPLDVNAATPAGSVVTRGLASVAGPFDQVFVGVGNYATGGGAGPVVLGASIVAHDVSAELTNPLP